jgi:RNA-directed DNA polymerase
MNKWLKVSVYEDGKYKSGKDNHNGTPQGGVISPLLANIYFHLIDRIVNNTQSLFSKHGVRMVRYADDFVLMGNQLPKEVIEKLNTLLHRMGLMLNKSKTRHIDAREESFNFLGFTIRYDKDIKGRSFRYWNIVPSKKSEQKIRDKVKVYLKTHGHYKANDISFGLNSIIRGWLNYFSISGVSYPAMSKRKLRVYLVNSLYRYYKRKSQRKSRLYRQNAFVVLVARFGLLDPSKYTYSSTRL